MARRVEGTTLGGFRCDMQGCEENGVVAPCVCVPIKGKSVLERPPITGLTDVHTCFHHFNDVRLDEQLHHNMRQQMREAADANGVVPDFDRAFLRPILVHTEAYLTFQQISGLVPHDDAVVEGSIEMPHL